MKQRPYSGRCTVCGWQAKDDWDLEWIASQLKTHVKEYHPDIATASSDVSEKGSERVSDDAVNHPAHYNNHPSGVECVTIAEAFNFNIGNAVKYCWRAGLKGDAIEDLSKARWYLDREIQRLQKTQS